MDNLGAIAICTEPYDKKRQSNPGLNKRVSRSNPIMGPDMENDHMLSNISTFSDDNFTIFWYVYVL